jgi:SpoVK/Ycf46/Vps4 family AAA+-type ATPase
VPPPDARARWEILRIHLEERPLHPDLELRPIVETTAGYAASDLEYIAEEGAHRALREQEPIATEHLEAAAAGVDSSVPDWAGSAIGDGKTVTQPDDVDLNARTLVTPSVERTFEDIGGMSGLLATLEEQVIDPLSRSGEYEEYDLGVTNGILLHGPPGCGKTYVAGALAGELDYSFLDVTPADLTSKWMGKPAQNVSDLFEIARSNQPCLVFLDELDAVAASRSGSQNTSQRQLVNQLLTELEAIDGTDVVVVAATNRVDDIDEAIRRSGRFDERIEVPPPDATARVEILQVQLADRPVEDDIDWKTVARQTEGYAASDITLLADNAARRAMHENSAVTEAHLLAAVDETHSSLDSWGGEQAGSGGEGARAAWYD